MPAVRNRRHLLVRTLPSAEPYQPHPRGGKPSVYPGPQNRIEHATALRDALVEAQNKSIENRRENTISVHGAEYGLYLTFESPPGVKMKLESLENKSKGIEITAFFNVRSESGESDIECATVFVPDGQIKYFFHRLQQYMEEKTQKGEPRHKDMIDRIATLQKATLKELWTDVFDSYPNDGEVIWWEVWLRRHDGQELVRLGQFATQVDLEVGEHTLGFDERIVTLVRGTSDQLSASLDILNDLAEVRKAKESDSFFLDISTNEQAEWIQDLRQRVVPALGNAPAVCILDTGITRGHPLLEDLIAPSDVMTVDPNWGGHDDGGGTGQKGHGTEMAGLAAYGDVVTALLSKAPVPMRHILESVKILPPTGSNSSELYGAITVQAVTRPEANGFQRSRVFMMAVTSTDGRDRGQPTSWSAAIDALATGRTFDPHTNGLIYMDNAEENTRRLFVLSVGNISTSHLSREHLDRSDLETVHDPAQAWNALTVGAYTERWSLGDPSYIGWSSLAKPGELSPWSTTSVDFEEKWPIKPDIVCEGGNVATDGQNFDNGVAELCLLSTNSQPTVNAFVLSAGTSTATALVARMCAIIKSEYPEYWPETIRALIVHSAEWTTIMKQHLNKSQSKKGKLNLVRRYGFGVPNLDRARRSASNAVTLVLQNAIRPFIGGRMREMHYYQLPWPKRVLEELGGARVSLRLTLSYFIEPNPGRRGWRTRHRYASHGLRFELKFATETTDEFRKRLNKLALDVEEEKPSSATEVNWYLGPVARNKGSIHSDIWVGTAADLAERGVIGVFPVSGWWKDQPKRDRSEAGTRYSLIASIETQAEDVDIWTSVARQLGVTIEEVRVK